MTNTFYLSKIEVRSTTHGDTPKYVVRGYAIAPNLPHTYKTVSDSSGRVTRTFKSYFTDNFVQRALEQLQHTDIFVDALHQTAANINIRSLLENMKKKAEQKGITLDDEISAIMANVKVTQLPLAKPTDFKIDDNGLYLETELNPAFREVDDSHKRYFDAVWYSLQHGYLNGMSFNFTPTKVVNEGGLERIDDGEVWGVSYVSNAALKSATGITEVAMRALTTTTTTLSGANNMENEKDAQKEIERLKQEIQETNAKTDALILERQAQTQAEKDKALEAERLAYKRQIDELNNKLEDANKTRQENETKISKGLVSQTVPVQGQMGVGEFRTKLEEARKQLGDKQFFGELLALQGEFNQLMPHDPDVDRLLRRNRDDTVFQTKT